MKRTKPTNGAAALKNFLREREAHVGREPGTGGNVNARRVRKNLSNKSY